MGDPEKLVVDLYLAGDTVSTIHDKTGIDLTSIREILGEDRRAIRKSLADAKARAAQLVEEAASDDKFRGLADAIRGLAASVASASKNGHGLKARDVLDLAKSVELAQRIKQRAKRRDG